MDLRGSESFSWRSTVWHCTVLPGIEEAPFTRRLESPCPRWLDVATREWPKDFREFSKETLRRFLR
ncbi:hypothetical protein V1477_017124 [Vespula maculifrons]|uniref:Uncharacterized protein n=1 Tax=Vespula maculifrons TaxID=7453 RepID=A0ABD2B5E4_VESMC